jgi:hypothetical protein
VTVRSVEICVIILGLSAERQLGSAAVEDLPLTAMSFTGQIDGNSVFSDQMVRIKRCFLRCVVKPFEDLRCSGQRDIQSVHDP